jgi:hypothetical protein
MRLSRHLFPPLPILGVAVDQAEVGVSLSRVAASTSLGAVEAVAGQSAGARGVVRPKTSRGFDSLGRGSLDRQSPVTSSLMTGRLRSRLQYWVQLAPGQYILDILEDGHTLPFLGAPPLFMGIRRTLIQGSPEKQRALRQEVQELLFKGAIQKVPPGQEREGWYGHYFLVVKKTGGWRPILNLRPLNKLLVVDSFKMESLPLVIRSVRRGEWLASLDLKDAYFHVPVRQGHWKFLRFCVQDQCYQYTVLPFGLSTSPRIFTKVLSLVMSQIRLQGVYIHPYLDDLLIRGSTFQSVVRSVQMVRQSLERAGFLINEKKSLPHPTQDLVYIGGRFRTDLGFVFLPLDRQRSLITLAASFVAGRLFSAQLWLRLLGVLAASIAVVPQARLRMRPLQMYLLSRWTPLQSLDVRLVVPVSLVSHIQWWVNHANVSQGSPLFRPPHNHVVTTDASEHGWGGGCWTM